MNIVFIRYIRKIKFIQRSRIRRRTPTTYRYGFNKLYKIISTESHITIKNWKSDDNKWRFGWALKADIETSTDMI